MPPRPALLLAAVLALSGCAAVPGAVPPMAVRQESRQRAQPEQEMEAS